MGSFPDRPPWPDSIDSSTIFLVLLLAVGFPLLGYVCCYLDIRAYWRSLRRVLVLTTHLIPEIPAWARCETPYCLKILGLRAPCTEAEAKKAYRRLAKEMHPDRGGDIDRFRNLAEQFEKALRYIQEERSLSEAEFH